jgi:serine phosphatase RsbU (regulator of sigma subunit)
MTTLELHQDETLRDRVRAFRRMRADGISVAARQSLLGPETGDHAEFVHLADRRWLIALVDAKSRGAEGAEIARDVVRHVALRVPTARRLGDVLATANDLVHDARGGDELVSAVLFVVDGSRKTIHLANAGQVAPLAVGRSGGVIALEGHGPALGLLPEQGYRNSGPLRLGTGMTVLAVTDGVHDAVDLDGNPFGQTGASTALAAARDRGAREVVRHVLAAVDRHGAPGEADDRTAIAFGFRG